MPKKDNKLLNVCQKCYDLLKSDSEKKMPTRLDQSPPKNFFKMVESNNSKHGQSNSNKEIEDRLKKLDANSKSIIQAPLIK